MDACWRIELFGGVRALRAMGIAANVIRNDGTMIYTIGLGSNGGVDNTLLRRMANDPAIMSSRISVHLDCEMPSDYSRSYTPCRLNERRRTCSLQLVRDSSLVSHSSRP